jgi:hypothetical protein
VIGVLIVDLASVDCAMSLSPTCIAQSTISHPQSTTIQQSQITDQK